MLLEPAQQAVLDQGEVAPAQPGDVGRLLDLGRCGGRQLPDLDLGVGAGEAARAQFVRAAVPKPPGGRAVRLRRAGGLAMRFRSSVLVRYGDDLRHRRDEPRQALDQPSAHARPGRAAAGRKSGSRRRLASVSAAARNWGSRKSFTGVASSRSPLKLTSASEPLGVSNEPVELDALDRVGHRLDQRAAASGRRSCRRGGCSCGRRR